MDNLVSWSADDGREHFTRRNVPGEANLAHSWPVVNHQRRSHFIVRHLTSVAVLLFKRES